MGKLIPIIGAAVVALLIGSGVGWFIGSSAAPAPVEAEHKEEAPHYIEYTIKDRIVNLADQGGRRYLKVTMVLQVLETSTGGKAQAQSGGIIDVALVDEGGAAGPSTAGGPPKGDPVLPNSAQVNDVISSVLSSKRSDDLLTNDGRDRLREELKAKINAVMPKEQQVVKVLFTEFIIQ